MGRIGSGVRVSVSFQRRVLSYDILRQQKTGVMTRGLTSLRLRRITSSPSQTLRRRLVRTTDAAVRARRSPPSLYFSHFATRIVDNIVDLYAAKQDIRLESRFSPTPPAFDAPVRGDSCLNIAIPFGMEKLEWLSWLPDGKKNFEDRPIFIRFRTIHERDGRTDTAWRHRPRLCIASRGKKECQSFTTRTSKSILLISGHDVAV